MKLSFSGFVIYALSLVVLSGIALGQTLYFEPSEVTLEEAGQQFAVELRIKDVQDLSGFQLMLSYDEAIVKKEKVEEGEFLKSDGAPTFAVPGEAIAYARLAATGIDGEGVLAIITFSVVEPKDGVVELTDVLLSDSAAQEIPVAEISPLTLKTKAAENKPPVAVAGPDVTAKVGEEIIFDAKDSKDEDGTIVTYKWSFGDGKEAEGAQVTKIYEAAGEYQVTLTVIDDKGAEATDTLIATIKEAGEAVIKEHTADSPMMALQVKFTSANQLGRAYVDVWKGELVVEEGMMLEYQIRMASGNPLFKAGVEVHTTDGTTFATLSEPAVDQNGVSATASTDLEEAARDKWYHRTIPLTALVGKTINVIMLGTESTEHQAGLFRAYVDNIQITDGNVRLVDIYIDGDNVPASGAPESTLTDTIPGEGVEDAKVSIEKVVAVEAAGKLPVTWASIKSSR